MREKECKRGEEGHSSQAGIIVTSVIVSSTMWQAADQPKPFDSLALSLSFFFSNINSTIYFQAYAAPVISLAPFLSRSLTQQIAIV